MTRERIHLASTIDVRPWTGGDVYARDAVCRGATLGRPLGVMRDKRHAGQRERKCHCSLVVMRSVMVSRRRSQAGLRRCLPVISHGCVVCIRRTYPNAASAQHPIHPRSLRNHVAKVPPQRPPRPASRARPRHRINSPESPPRSAAPSTARAGCPCPARPCSARTFACSTGTRTPFQVRPRCERVSARSHGAQTEQKTMGTYVISRKTQWFVVASLNPSVGESMRRMVSDCTAAERRMWKSKPSLELRVV